MASNMVQGTWFNPIIINDDPSMTPGIGNPPAHFTNNLDVIILDDTLLTAPSTSTPASMSTPPSLSTAIRPPVRFGIMRTGNQLCRLLEESYNNPPDDLHTEIDQPYGQFCLKFSSI
ncbi:hypothetical protein FBEOM_1111 [Fusarium beomiforme]|uniref:Uncharacterized protein n=1 Tax=Fusarium beomiforme TaxID=44412 RepID=A0A9P5ATT0_9HYPO|nr:hypothetical protein FBEOM_1111 [Fusarium beomiforme]